MAQNMRAVAAGEHSATSDPFSVPKAEKTAPVNNAMDNRFNKAPGGGSKPISPNQLKTIEAKAIKVGIDLEQYVRQHFGKPVSELTGSDAHELINNHFH
jgi:hypothetical protein